MNDDDDELQQLEPAKPDAANEDEGNKDEKPNRADRPRPLQVHTSILPDIQEMSDNKILIEYYESYGNKQLVKECEQKFNTLYQRYERQLYTYLLAITHDDSIARDIFEKIWETVYVKGTLARSVAQNQAEGKEFNFKSYLFKIARNKWLDYCRQVQRHQETSLDEMLDNEEAPLQIAADESCQPEEQLQREEEQLQEENKERLLVECLEHIKTAIKKLPSPQQEAMTLHYFTGIELKEIAQIQNMQRDGVYSSIRRAKEKLKPIWLRCKEAAHLSSHTPKKKPKSKRPKPNNEEQQESVHDNCDDAS